MDGHPTWAASARFSPDDQATIFGLIPGMIESPGNNFMIALFEITSSKIDLERGGSVCGKSSIAQPKFHTLH